MNNRVLRSILTLVLCGFFACAFSYTSYAREVRTGEVEHKWAEIQTIDLDGALINGKITEDGYERALEIREEMKLLYQRIVGSSEITAEEFNSKREEFMDLYEEFLLILGMHATEGLNFWKLHFWGHRY